MLNLNDPVRYTTAEKAFVDSTLKPLGKKGWDDGRLKTQQIKNKGILLLRFQY